MDRRLVKVIAPMKKMDGVPPHRKEGHGAEGGGEKGSSPKRVGYKSFWGCFTKQKTGGRLRSSEGKRGIEFAMGDERFREGER